MVNAADVVLLLGYNGFGSINRLAPAVRRRGLIPIAVVNRDSTTQYSEDCAEVLRCDNMFDAERVADTLTRRFSSRAFGGLCSQADLLTFVYSDLCERLLDVPHPPIEPLKRCRLKAHLRRILASDSRDNVAHMVIRARADCEAWATRGGFPCIAKPVAASGSLAVRRCNTVEELQAYREMLPSQLTQLFPTLADRIVTIDGCEYRLGQDVLVEEELVGPELTCDGYVRDGRVHMLLYLDMVLTRDRFAFLDLGYVNPPIRVDAPGLAEIELLLQRTLGRVEYGDFMFHGEVKWTLRGPRIVEMNPRFGGAAIPDMVKLATGVDPAELFVALSLGEGPAGALPASWGRPPAIGYATLFAERNGTLRGVTGLERLRQLRTLTGEPMVVSQPGELVTQVIDKKYVAFAKFAAGSVQEIVCSLHEAGRIWSCDVT